MRIPISEHRMNLLASRGSAQETAQLNFARFETAYQLALDTQQREAKALNDVVTTITLESGVEFDPTKKLKWGKDKEGFFLEVEPLPAAKADPPTAPPAVDPQAPNPIPRPDKKFKETNNV